jgi:predicted DsbA family dithiol-disulfide isomerase
MRIEIWSDIACPWCFIGKRRFEKALSDFEHREEVDVHWRSFELDPDAPSSYDISIDELLSKKYGVTMQRAAEMNEHLTRLAALDGLTFHTALMRPGNTFDAHRLTHFAATHGKRDAMTERLMKAYLEEGVQISDRRELSRLAVEVGLDEMKTEEVLSGDAFSNFVRDDERTAHELAINGVPFFVINDRYAISGAQPPTVFLEAMKSAWANQEVADAEPAGQCNDASCTVHH